MQSQVKPPSKGEYDSSRKMTSVQYVGKKKVKVGESPMPIVTDPTDAIIKITAATICGSDLHFYERAVPGMTPGYVMGHEGVGIVEDVGPEVKNFKKGDRVVVSAVLGCGQCAYCKRGEWSCCDTTNPNVLQEKLHGHSIGGFIGYSHAFGGYDGCHAEYVRVVFADVNLFHIPDDITDKQAICMPDVAPTAYHGTFLTDIKEGDTVAIFGCGPVGLLTQMWAKYRGASVVVAIDVDQQRLDFAKEKFGSEIVNSKDEDPVKAVHKLIPGGPDIVIDCVGFRFPDTLLHKIEFKLKLETDAPNIVNAAMEMVRKNGKVGVIGDYAAFANHFNIGALMEKHLTVSGGCVWPQTHYKLIFEAMQSGKVDPTVIFTHTFPLSKTDEAYKKFDSHEDGTIKVLILADEIYNKTNQANK